MVDEPEVPANPFGPWMEAAVYLHELKKGFTEAGFSEAQAFELCRTVLAENLRKTPPNTR